MSMTDPYAVVRDPNARPKRIIPPKYTLRDTVSASPLTEPGNSCVNINRIGRYNLFAPMSAIIDLDESGYVATTPDVPQVYGCGDTIGEAISMLKDEILSLHHDLQRDDEYTPDLLALKDFFRRIFNK